MTDPELTAIQAPVRVVRVEIPTHVLSEELFGQGISVPRCTVVFRNMLPAKEPCFPGASWDFNGNRWKPSVN